MVVIFFTKRLSYQQEADLHEADFLLCDEIILPAGLQQPGDQSL
jgi:hypothetical protein